MSSVLFKSIQAYYRAWTIGDIQGVCSYVLTKNNPQPVFPPGLNNEKRQLMVQRFFNGWEVEGRRPLPIRRLFYRPNDRINLELIPPNRRFPSLELLYNDETAGALVGQTKFFQQVTRRYIGITKRMTDIFLQRKGNRQVTRPFKQGHSKLVVSTKPNAIWGMDCIYMTHFDNIPGVNLFPGTNRKALYILTVVDHFSKKVWARALARNHLDAVHVLAAFRQIVAQAQATHCKVLISDGGVEFRGPWDAYCQQNNINHRRTNPGSPTENALCERMNRIIREKLNEMMVRNNSNEWLAHLQTVVDNTNNQVAGGTNYTPNELWTPLYQAGHQVLPVVGPANDNDNMLTIRARIMQRNRQRWQTVLQKDRNRRFVLGDRVFVSIKLLSTAIRQYLKNGLGSTKNIPVKYVPQMLTISAVRPGIGFTKERYNLRNVQGVLVEKNNRPWDFYASQLVLVPRLSTPTGLDPNDFYRAMQVNNFQDNNDAANFQQGLDNDDDDDAPQAPAPAPPQPPAPVPRPILQWHSKEWNEALKNKEFTDFVEDDREPPSRCTIVKVLYDRRERSYLVEYVKVGDRPFLRNMNQALLHEVLELARGEDWFLAGFEEFIRGRGPVD